MATTYGICSIVARIATIFAPMVAEFKDKRIPLIIITVMNLLALVSTIFLRKKST